MKVSRENEVQGVSLGNSTVILLHEDTALFIVALQERSGCAPQGKG